MAKQHLIFNYFEIYGTIRLNLAYGTDQKKKKKNGYYRNQ